jgi:hypothetical protein
MPDIRFTDDYVELNRSFHELSSTRGDSDDADLHSVFSSGGGVTWSALLEEYRAVLLSEAGSGKTKEIRSAVQRLRGAGKAAFFLRLEHVTGDFESAFEEGDNAEFERWLASSDEGWLLLDSVDEARLRSPADFERAIRKIGRKVSGALQRTHIVITGRTTAWRPKTDLSLCVNTLPYVPVQEAAEFVEGEEANDADVITVRKKSGTAHEPKFKIMTLDDLTPAQIEIFAQARGVVDTKAFTDAIERADAWSFTARPQDLSEVIEFWQDHRRIGSRLELMRNSIERRLTERDQNRAEIRSLTAEKAGLGARQTAGATTMVQKQTIRVPDGAENPEGLPITRILRKWDEKDCAVLLSRPIFDEAIYGAVRFHHRSVREYLAAEWLNELLGQQTSRAAIEQLFFREQYGREVIVPSLRPLLPWMLILNERIRVRALRLAPELVFEGGDPSQLPLDTRRQLLREICARVATNPSSRATTDYAAVQRFASAELADEVARLLKEHASNSDILWLLLRMIWQGQMSALLPAAKGVALDPKSSKYPRIAAFRAVAAIGSDADFAEVRAAFLNERVTLNRDWLAELINNTKPSQESANWLVAAVAKTRRREEFTTDGLKPALANFVEQAALSEITVLVAGLSKLLAKRPVVERRHCEISVRYGWLAQIIATGLQRLIQERHEAVFHAQTLDALRRHVMANDHHDYELQKADLRLPELVQSWPELNERLFWFEVACSRKERKKKRERLTNWWHVSWGGSLWAWREQDFPRVLGYIQSRPALDDKLVALSLAFDLYRRSGRLPRHRVAMWKAVTGTPELEAQLHQYLHPPRLPPGERSWKSSEQRWKKRREERARKDAEHHEKWRIYLAENIEKLREPGLSKPSDISNAQYYLQQQMEDDEGKRRWRGGSWKSLIFRHGEAVAQAFRDGAISYWRRNTPKLRSEGAEANRTLFSTIFGLTALEMEAEDTASWPNGLNSQEAEIATRYAIYELNGYPAWMPKLYSAFPDAVTSVLMSEVRWELGRDAPEQESLYVLNDISWYGDWMWDKWGPIFLKELGDRDPVNTKTLGLMLKVI